MRTDGGLKVLEQDIVNLRCRLQPQIVPGPPAFPVNGTDPASLQAQSAGRHLA